MKFDFGEKEQEKIKGQNLPVWQSPKYLISKKKIVEMLESKEWGNVLEPSDFWILMNTYDEGKKMMYSGLIISHNGCLKINDNLERERKFKPECVSYDKEGYGGALVYHYRDNELYEVGEVTTKNCKNDYPYAMAFKRCFDRVVLKKSKLAYYGVYSDSEADEFKEVPQEKYQKNNKEKDVLEILDNANKITKIQESALRDFITNKKIDEVYVIDLLKEFNCKKLSELQIKDYMTIKNTLEELTKN